MKSLRLILASLALYKIAAEGDDHGHGEHPFEFGATFETPDDNYWWISQKVDGEYADPSLKIVILDVDDAEEGSLDDAAEVAEELFEGEDCSELQPSGTLTPPICAILRFDTSNFQSIYKVRTKNTDAVAIFTEHYPTEFEMDSHYFRDEEGEDVEPVHEFGEEDEDGINWGGAILGSILVNLTTFAGVFTSSWFCGKYTNDGKRVKGESLAESSLYRASTSAFAAGCLLATAFFLILFESTHLIGAGDFEEETDITWRWGTCILGGFVSIFVIDVITSLVLMPAAGAAGNQSIELATSDANESQRDAEPEVPTATVVEDQKTEDQKTEDQKTEDEKTSEVTVSHLNKSSSIANLDADVHVLGGVASKKSVSQSLLANTDKDALRVQAAVLVGDFMHNFADGIFIGTAFKACNNSVAWGIVGGTIAHEFSQEIADLLVLTTRGKLSLTRALLWNFISGTSVLWGALLVLGLEITDVAVGCILAFGGGIYIYTAACECIPVVVQTENAMDKFRALIWFFIGAVAIGLVLIEHGHCIADGDSHAGHNH